MPYGIGFLPVVRLIQTDRPFPGWDVVLRDAYEFLSPYNEFLIFLFVLWLFARRGRPKSEDFNRQAQEVLDRKYKSGEISRKTYEKYRQDISLRPKR